MRYILGVIAIIFVAFLAVWLVFVRTPSTNQAPAQSVQGSGKMTSYSNQGAVVSLTTRGRLVGETERRAVRVSVSPTERRVEILEGYNETVVRTQTYANTQAGYDNFLHAMDLNGFSRTKKPAVTDERGVCPSGNQYIYDVSVGGSRPVHSWSTSCTVAEGTFAGVASTIRALFQAQIPDYNAQVSSVRL